MNTILCPLDFSEVSLNALDFATAIAARSGASLTLLHVEMPVMVAHGEAIREAPQLSEMTQKGFEKAMNRVKSNPGGSELEIDTQTASGDAAEMILMKAGEISPDLLIMGTTGASGLLESLFGTVASAVAGRSEIPALIIPGAAKFSRLKNILFATEVASTDKWALGQLKEFSAMLDANIEALCILSEEDFPEDEVEKIKQEGVALGNIPVKMERHADPIAGLNTYIESRKVDMIALVGRQRSWFSRLVNPSLTRNLVKYGDHPVMVFQE